MEFKLSDVIKPNNPRIHCSDGFSLSVQAGEAMYCSPREDYPENGYSHVEVGFPSEPVPDDWEVYSDEFGVPADECWYPKGKGVYCYVPVEKVMYLIQTHGGIVKGHLPITRKEQTLKD